MSPEGEDFRPHEPYTHRLRRILEEYPDGSQVLREILQNSDDAKSTEQIFILDHNKYPSDNLFIPELNRFQGPALLAKNNQNFNDRDFESLLKLADSEKHDQFDKIGVMGVGFNSIYHLTDSPSFITDDKYVILDPHEWYYNGGKKFNFIKGNLAKEYPDQFAPFKISGNEPRNEPFKKPFRGTIFRYPLRDSDKSDISKKIYKPEEILDMFKKFYEKESINCLLFLKYVECIRFYELKAGATELELLYTIQLENADNVRRERQLIAENIVSMMDSLKSKRAAPGSRGMSIIKKNKDDRNKLETSSYVASISRQEKGNLKKTNSWLILNYLDDLLETEAYFQKNFGRNIRDYKFIPNVGLAIPLNNSNVTGRLFCFLPLPIDMPFPISVHGYFAVSTNRRTLWSNADNEDTADDALARLKVKWNEYLFEKVLPKAWAKFLRELPFKVSNIQSNNVYNFWPIVKKTTKSGIMSSFCDGLLKNVIENLDMKDHVFKGPSSLDIIGTVPNFSADSYDASPYGESEFHWLSISNGYLKDEELFGSDLTKIIGNIGFPVISTLSLIIGALKDSKHKHSLNFFSPAIIRTYLNHNIARWEKTLSRKEILQLFEYILRDEKFDKLEGLKMIPLADGTLGTCTLRQSGSSYVYIYDSSLTSSSYDECNIFKNQLNKFVDKSIENYELYQCLYKNAKAGWKLNIKILNESAVADMIRFSLSGYKKNSEEIPMPNNSRGWIYQLWDNLRYRDWDLTYFEDIHLIPTNRSTLRKLKTSKKIFSRKNISDNLISIFEKFGAVFVDNKFDIEWNKMNPYVINPDDIASVLDSFQSDTSYPRNLNCTLRTDEASVLANHLSINLQRRRRIKSGLIDVIHYLPIFTKVDHASPVSLRPGNGNWYLLPCEEENSYGKIIYPSDEGGFLSTSSRDICYILEDIIGVPRLTVNEYWRNYVIPFLESQSPKDIDIVVDKLFDRLPALLDKDPNLGDVLGGKSFVPAGTLKMSQQQQTSHNINLFKPVELFNPEEKTLTDLFFDDERVFPAGRYGIPRPFSSKKFLSSLESLGIKSVLSPDDIDSRIDIITQRQTSRNINESLIHANALKLFKYLDKKWEQFDDRNSRKFSKAILEKKWIPTVDNSGRIVFSKSQECYCEKYKNLVCFVAPVLNYNPKNTFLKYLNWDTPDVKTVLRQLEFCRNSVARKQPPKELKYICNAIYEYMNESFKNDTASFEYMKKSLENRSWILCGNKFHSSNEVVVNFTLPNKFQNNGSLIVKLPIEYTSKFEGLFKAMEVRDEIGIKDLILIIKNIAERNGDTDLSLSEIDNVVQIIEQIIKIQKNNRIEGKGPEKLDGLLIPSTKNKLVSLQEIHFDDMEDRLDNEKKSEYMIAHDLVSLHVAKGLNIQTLTGKIYGINAGDMDWEVYEQHESLTTRIKNIIKDYPLDRLIKEFLQNVDDAKATRFSVIVDRRQHVAHKKSLLSEEMRNFQGPAVWIYNDAVFSKDDFRGLAELGIGGKSRDKNKDDTRIGRFGIGFNCAFHITDLPSLVSGEYVVFLDPHAKFLPATEYPPRRRKGIRINFIEKEFKKNCPDQCYPYEAIEGCDFTKEFNGTLFRLPLRKFVGESKISNRVFEINDILKIFDGIQSNQEMLFLRNIESCSLYEMKEYTQPQLIWQAKIKNHDICKSRQKVIDSIDDAQIYQLEIERDNYFQNKKVSEVSEIWAVCTGGHDSVKSEFKKFSEEKQLKPRGGVACLLAQSDEKSLGELRAESFPNPPELKGEMFSYLSLSRISHLGVHLNGNFSLNSARLQSENDSSQSNSIEAKWDRCKASSEDNFSQSNSTEAKWDRYIILEVLPDLHVKLLEYIVELEKERHKKESANFIPHITNSLWPINKKLTSDLYKKYGLNVIRKLGLNGKKFFWTEANGGQFVSLQKAKILEKEKMDIAEILINLKVPIQVVKLDKEQMEHMDKIVESREPLDFPYTPIRGKLLCDELKKMRLRKSKDNIIHNNVDNTKHIHYSLFQLLSFILQDKDSFESLEKLPLVPLSDSVGEFGNVYYIGKQKHLELFPNAGPSKFIISTDLPKDLLEIFSSDEFSELNIRKFDNSAILDLLEDELPNVATFEWDPNGTSIPNNTWLEKIWLMLNKTKDIDFDKLSKLPLLPVTKPDDLLIQPNINDPLLHIPENGHILFPVLVKLKMRLTFTDKIFKIFTENEGLKKYVIEPTPINIFKSLEKTCSSLNLTIKELFENGNLSSSDYEKFRKFIKEELRTLIEHAKYQGSFMTFLKSLPIWAINSCEDEFIDAKSGILLPYNLPFFSFRKNTNIYKCGDEADFNALTLLGATSISELDYVKNHILPDFIKFATPSPSYIPFLQRVLSLNNPEIEKYFKRAIVIPNKSLTEFVKADTLYDINDLLFRSIFADTDKTLPTELQNDPVCLEALGRIGLRRQVNCNAYIECAQEVKLQIQRGIIPPNIVRDRAKRLVRYLYEHVDTLRFSPEQWKQVLRIRFVPSEMNFRNQFYQQKQKQTSGFETFEKLRAHKYKKICWTQCPLFDEFVEPTTSFSEHRPEIGKPSTENIIKHWFAIKTMSTKEKTWDSNCKKELKSVIEEIYRVMNETSKDENHNASVKLEISGEKIFLNGNDPFNEQNWVAGKDLVFCSSEDNIIEGMYNKVKDCLKDYKDLLLLAGAIVIESPPPPTPNLISDQKGKLTKSLLDRLLIQSDDDEYHDAIFIVGGEKIRASRYVLSAASKYFERMFYGGLSESTRNEPIQINDIHPDVFRVLLQWLYGQPFEEAIESVEHSDYSFFVGLLKATDFYGIELKSEVEDKIITRVSVVNAYDILEQSKMSNATRLIDYCKGYIKSNKEIVTNQLLELHEDVSEEEVSQKLDYLLSDDI